MYAVGHSRKKFKTKITKIIRNKNCLYNVMHEMKTATMFDNLEIKNRENNRTCFVVQFKVFFWIS